MRRLVRFYENNYSANDRIFYLFDDITTRWTDLKLQIRENYINWLFPSESDENTKLSKGLLYKFRTNPYLRLKVIKATLRMMSLFGYSVSAEDPSNLEIVQIKPIYRQEGNVVIGLFNPVNYPRITRILKFLKEVDMSELSALFFLMICKATSDAPDLKHIIQSHNVAKEWIATQPYLETRKYLAEEVITGSELASWEKTDEEVVKENLANAEIIRDAWNE
jgi:hypothetical protein